jgi:hypothetical protein
VIFSFFRIPIIFLCTGNLLLGKLEESFSDLFILIPL